MGRVVRNRHPGWPACAPRTLRRQRSCRNCAASAAPWPCGWPAMRQPRVEGLNCDAAGDRRDACPCDEMSAAAGECARACRRSAPPIPPVALPAPCPRRSARARGTRVLCVRVCEGARACTRRGCVRARARSCSALDSAHAPAHARLGGRAWAGPRAHAHARPCSCRPRLARRRAAPRRGQVFRHDSRETVRSGGGTAGGMPCTGRHC